MKHKVRFHLVVCIATKGEVDLNEETGEIDITLAESLITPHMYNVLPKDLHLPEDEIIGLKNMVLYHLFQQCTIRTKLPEYVAPETAVHDLNKKTEPEGMN